MTRRPKARPDARAGGKAGAGSGRRSNDPAAPTAGPGSVRIIGGTLRGRKIDYGGDRRTRPMKDRLREAVFNLLGDVTGTLAIDLFAGTGVLGFEALSRGASRAVFLEQHFPTADLIRRNAAALGVSAESEVTAADTLLWVRRSASLPEGDGRPWLVFCSPPYELYVSRRDEMLALIERLWTAAPAASQFVVEADERFDFAHLCEPAAWRLRSYPPAQVGFAVKP